MVSHRCSALLLSGRGAARGGGPRRLWYPGTGRRGKGEGRKRKRGGAKLELSPLDSRRERELLRLHGPEGAPWGQPSERRALWTRGR